MIQAVDSEQFGRTATFGYMDYTVTRCGKVYSWKRLNSDGTPILMQGTLNFSGISYQIDGMKMSGHKLVMNAWRSREDNINDMSRSLSIFHLDGNKYNNDLDNLCYGTTAEYKEFRKWYQDYMEEVNPQSSF